MIDFQTSGRIYRRAGLPPPGQPPGQGPEDLFPSDIDPDDIYEPPPRAVEPEPLVGQPQQPITDMPREAPVNWRHPNVNLAADASEGEIYEEHSRIYKTLTLRQLQYYWACYRQVQNYFVRTKLLFSLQRLLSLGSFAFLPSSLSVSIFVFFIPALEADYKLSWTS
jgi:hypothetical protein